MPFQRRGSCIFHWRRRAWLTIWDKVKSLGTVIDRCTGRVWLVNCMTVISTWWQSNMAFTGQRKWHIPMASYGETFRHLFNPSFLAGLLDNIQCPYRAVVNKFLLVVLHMRVCVKGSAEKRHLWVRPYFSNSPAWLVHLIWMGFEMGGRRPYGWCFVGCCFQYLFNIARSILVQLPSSFFAIRLVSVQVVHPLSSMDMTAAWKKCFLFYQIGLPSIWTITYR